MNYEERLLKELPHITPADADAMARAAVYQGCLLYTSDAADE